MAKINPLIDFVTEEAELRRVYISAPAQSRLNIISKRLNQSEIGSVKLVTSVSAIEALARSLVVNLRTTPQDEISNIYKKYRNKKPEELVEEFLEHHGHSDCSVFFKNDTWNLFKNAVNFRNLIVHECTYLGQDKYPKLILACDEVLDSLIKISKLSRK